jgi:hypothetical protein
MQILLFSFRYSSFIMNRYLRSLFVASALAVNGSVVGFAGDKWTDSSGTKTIEAEFVKLDGIQLTIKKSDGKEIVIPLYKLDNTSRLLARKLAKTPRSTASASSTSSDTEAVTTTSSSGGSGGDIFPPNATAREFFDIVVRELEKKNFAIFWDAMPPSQQADLEQLVQLALTKVDQKSLDEIGKFKKEVVGTLQAKKTFILNSKALPIDNNMRPIISQAYEPALGVLDVVLSADLLTLDKLKSAKPREFIQDYSSRIVVKLDALLKMIPFPGDPMATITGTALTSLKEMQIKTVSDSEVSTKMTSQDGPPIEETYIKVEGRWVSKKLWSSWKTMKAQAEQAINSLEAKTINLQVKQALAAAKIPLGILAEAETQEDVDDIIGGIVKQVQAAAAANMGAGGMGGFAPSNSQANMTTNPRANKTAASSPSQATGKNTQHRFEQLSFALPERFQRRDIPAGALPPGMKIAAFVDLSPQGTSNAIVSINLMPNKDGDAVNIRQQLVNLTEGTANGMKFKIASRGKNEESEWNGFRFTHFSFLVSSPDGGMVGGRAYGTRHEDDLLLISHIAFVGEPPEIIDEIKDCVATIRIDTTTK